MDKINLSVIREVFGRVVYTHKTYEKASDICQNKFLWIKRINVILLVLTSGSAITSLFEGQLYIIITSILATLSLFFVIYQLSFNFSELAERYKATAKKLWFIREKYQNLIADIINNCLESDEIVKKRDTLLNELNEILTNSVATNKKAYLVAKKALKIEDEMNFTKDEIDSFLPKELNVRDK